MVVDTATRSKPRHYFVVAHKHQPFPYGAIKFNYRRPIFLRLVTLNNGKEANIKIFGKYRALQILFSFSVLDRVNSFPETCVLLENNIHNTVVFWNVLFPNCKLYYTR